MYLLYANQHKLPMCYFLLKWINDSDIFINDSDIFITIQIFLHVIENILVSKVS